MSSFVSTFRPPAPPSQRSLRGIQQVESIGPEDLCGVCGKEAKTYAHIRDLDQMENLYNKTKRVNLPCCGRVFHHYCLNTITHCNQCHRPIPTETKVYVETLTRYLHNTEELCGLLEAHEPPENAIPSAIALMRLLKENAEEFKRLAERTRQDFSTNITAQILAKRAENYAEHASIYAVKCLDSLETQPNNNVSGSIS